MFTPSNTTRPASGSWRPVMTLNRVVFPAPLGPISPVTRPGSTSMLASDSARRPPKRTTMSSVASSATAHLHEWRLDRALPKPVGPACEVVGHAEDVIQLGHLLGRERPGEAEVADLV